MFTRFSAPDQGRAGGPQPRGGAQRPGGGGGGAQVRDPQRQAPARHHLVPGGQGVCLRYGNYSTFHWFPPGESLIHYLLTDRLSLESSS